MVQKPWGAGSLSVPLCPVFLQSSRRLLPGRCDLFSGGPFRLVCRQQRPALPPYAAILLKAFVKGVRGYFSYYLRRFSLCFCLNNAFQPVLSSQTAAMVKKHFDFIICFALLNHKNSIRFVFLLFGFT